MIIKFMENNSILDQIINSQTKEEIANMDAVEILNNLFNELNERERDVLARRYGLHGKEKDTLEKIGEDHKLTRERIRQIENSAVKKLLQLENLTNYISNLKKVINQLIEEHGGFIEQNYLLDNLVNISATNVRASEEEKILHKNHLDFLVSKLLQDEFEKVENSKHFKNYFKFKHQILDHLEEIAEELLKNVKELKKIMVTEEIINLTKQTESYKKYEDKLQAPNAVDLSNILKKELFEEDSELINSNKTIYSILQAAKRIEQNKFGHWGADDSREITPKTINDKIYLVLSNHGKPMHFKEIAERINEVNFDKKIANAATVHNELILDKKYVLIGRGLYGLKDWGYKKGTVADIIIEILKNSAKPLAKDEILEEVLKQRLVKKATVILALMNKDKFKKVEGGKYALKD